jgi:hypothetical protein
LNPRYLLAFALTFLIELPIVLVAQRRWNSRPWPAVAWDALLVNGCSHPLAVYFFLVLALAFLGPRGPRHALGGAALSTAL